jgi:hypothetical protein
MEDVAISSDHLVTLDNSGTAPSQSRRRTLRPAAARFPTARAHMARFSSAIPAPSPGRDHERATDMSAIVPEIASRHRNRTNSCRIGHRRRPNLHEALAFSFIAMTD